MFQKWSSNSGTAVVNGNDDKTLKKDIAASVSIQGKSENTAPVSKQAAEPKKANTILKGSKMKGDITVTNDLELSGDVEGNIRSFQDSNIVLKGNCKGSIETKDGSIKIEGSLEGGNIVAGKDVIVTGKFNGGEVKAKNKIYVDGEFNGRLKANDIEIGYHASGNGELLYKEFISIARGAKANVQISHLQQELKVVDK